MFLYDIARKINTYRKVRRKAAAGRYLSPVRRIERTAPLSSGRYVAMTFDDGPSAAYPYPPVKGPEDTVGLTAELLQILGSYNSKGTFDVIGTTEQNYPDKEGPRGDFTWSGIKYDHYPEFGKDELAGVRNQLQLARDIIAGGHELANHGYRHMLFGPMKLVYGNRVCFQNLREVIDDLETLDKLVLEETGRKMRLSRPPHYIDRIPDGNTSYDAYRYMNYQYLAACFDAGGWKPSSGDYLQDVKAMTDLIENALSKDPGILNGHIIFQKDGYNMSLQTPVAGALDKSLKLLSDAGYKVVTASELIEMSPFEDINDADPCFESVRKLAAAGFVIGYKNNTFQADRPLTGQELAIMTTPPEILLKKYRESIMGSGLASGSGARPASNRIQPATVLECAMKYIHENDRLAKAAKYLDSDQPVSASIFSGFLDAAADGSNVDWEPNEFSKVGVQSQRPEMLRRRDVIKALAELNLKNNR